jgi:hypothetical protein
MFKVSRKIKNAISEKISSLVDSIKKKLSDGDLSLKRLYLNSAKEEGSFYPDLNSFQVLVDATMNYLDGFKTKTTNEILNNVESSKNVKETLTNDFAKASRNLETIISTQTQSVKNLGALNGIFNISTIKGIEDPVIYFAGPNDNVTCSICKKLYFTDAGVPRVWKVSELKTSFFNHKHDNVPSIHSAHPNCRHTPTLVLPGYGFSETGRLVWISEKHSELKKQRG